MKKGKLLHTTSLSTQRMRGRIGRQLRGDNRGDETGAGAGGESGAGGNNPGGNSGESGAADSTKNNGGLPVAPDAFWLEPEVKKPADGESKADENAGAETGKALAARIDSLAFDPIFDDTISEQINKGDLTGINDRLQKHGRDVTRTAVVESAKLMQVYGANILAQVKEMIQGTLSSRDNNQTLLEAFPSAKDPAVRPMIQGVFEQSMKHTGNDRAKAIELTRNMLKVVGNKAQSDFEISTPPGGREDFQGSGPSDLVAELLRRDG